MYHLRIIIAHSWDGALFGSYESKDEAAANAERILMYGFWEEDTLYSPHYIRRIKIERREDGQERTGEDTEAETA